MARHAIGTGAGTLGNLVLAKLVGPSHWGSYAVAIFFLSVGADAVSRVFSSYLVRASAPLSPGLVSLCLLMQAGLGVAYGAVVVFLAYPMQTLVGALGLAQMLWAVAFASVLYSIRSVAIAWLERELKFTQVAIVELVDIIGFQAVTLAGILGGGDPGRVFALGFAVRALTSTSIGAWLAHFRPALLLESGRFRELVRWGRHVALANLATVGQGLVPTMITGALLGARAVGLQQLALGLMAPFWLTAVIAARLCFPGFSALRGGGTSQTALADGVIAALVAVQTPLLGLLVGLSPIWIGWYGVEWKSVGVMLLLLMPGYMVASPIWHLSSAFMAAGRVEVLSLYSTGLTMCYVVLAVPATWLFGQFGVPLALTVASTLGPPILWILFRRIGGVPLSPRTWYLLGAGILGGVLVWVSSHQGPPTLGLGVAAFLLAGWVLVTWRGAREGWRVLTRLSIAPSWRS